MANLSSYLPGGIDPAAVTITGGTINGTTIGASTAAAGTFTTLTANDHVLVGGAVAGNAGSKTVSIGDAGSTAGGLQLWAGTTQTSYVQFGDESGTAANHYRGFMAYAHNGDSLRLGTAGSERMRIDSSGNLGIGTSSPSTSGPLSIEKDSAASSEVNISLTNGTGNKECILNFGKNLSTADRYRGRIFYQVDNDVMGFWTGQTERMRIDSSGGLRIGTTTNGFNTPASEKLTIKNTAIGCAAHFESTDLTGGFPVVYVRSTDSTAAGQVAIYFYRTNTAVGSITTTGSSTSYNTSSDERLKENIVDAPAGNIDAIRVRSFDWKVDGSHQTYGMVAQELVDVAPEAVTQGETWAVDYSKLVPMMIKEIQDLKAEVAALKGA